MGALLVHDICNTKSKAYPSTQLRNPVDLFKGGAFHGGVWRCGYKVGSIGEAAALRYYLGAYGPSVGARSGNAMCSDLMCVCVSPRVHFSLCEPHFADCVLSICFLTVLGVYMSVSLCPGVTWPCPYLYESLYGLGLCLCIPSLRFSLYISHCLWPRTFSDPLCLSSPVHTHCSSLSFSLSHFLRLLP